jgi:hypothetical protein
MERHSARTASQLVRWKSSDANTTEPKGYCRAADTSCVSSPCPEYLQWRYRCVRVRERELLRVLAPQQLSHIAQPRAVPLHGCEHTM